MTTKPPMQIAKLDDYSLIDRQTLILNPGNDPELDFACEALIGTSVSGLHRDVKCYRIVEVPRTESDEFRVSKGIGRSWSWTNPAHLQAMQNTNQETSEAMSETKLLCEGAYYRNRRGEKIGPMYKNTFSQEPSWKVQGEQFSLMYFSDGSVSQAGTSDCDLIEFWPNEPTPPEPADYEFESAPLVPTHTVKANVVKLDKMPGMNCDEEPAAPAEASGEVDPGEGWRLLKVGEMVERGDEVWYRQSGWYGGVWAGIRVPDGLTYRRRIPAPVEQSPIADVWQHEREEYRKAITLLGEQNERLIKQIPELTAERDKLRAELAEAQNEIVSCGQLQGELREQLAAIKSEAEEVKVEKWRDLTHQDHANDVECQVRNELDGAWNDAWLSFVDIGNTKKAFVAKAYDNFVAWRYCRIRQS